MDLKANNKWHLPMFTALDSSVNFALTFLSDEWCHESIR